MYIFGWRKWSSIEELNREEIAMKLIFLMKILKMRNSVCPEENHSEDIEASRFTLSVLFSSHLSNRNTVLLKGVKVTHWNEFPHDAQPKPNPTKSLKWGIRVTWGLSQLRVPTVSIATPHHWSYPHQRSYYLRALMSNHVGMLPGYKQPPPQPLAGWLLP